VIGWLRCAFFGAVVAGFALASIGCGGGATAFAPATPAPVGGNGELTYALSGSPGTLDPLAARSISGQTVIRQIFEPLVASQNEPYGGRRNVPGVAISIHHSADRRVWSLRLRQGLKFQDGRILDAAAVLANERRWVASPVGRALLPGLIGADGPRPDLVRFVFAQPVSDPNSSLGDPRLGLVSPSALSSGSGAASLLRVAKAGSGPFQLSGRPGGTLLLRRNPGWWGSRVGLGPALDEISFRTEPSAAGRLGLLRAGGVQVAGDVGPAAAQLRADPLLGAVGVTGSYPIGIERSVRGIVVSQPQSLAGVWLTGIDR
jgi:peptide/nickel transport system substrate-binding protein